MFNVDETLASSVLKMEDLFGRRLREVIVECKQKFKWMQLRCMNLTDKEQSRLGEHWFSWFQEDEIFKSMNMIQ